MPPRSPRPPRPCSNLALSRRLRLIRRALPPRAALLGSITALAALGCWAISCHAQSSPDTQIDPALLGGDSVQVTCNFRTWPLAADCVRRVLPSLSYRVAW